LDDLVCLDLEGTLISNAVSQIPRPGLREFLEEVKTLADVILYTSVSPKRTEEIKKLLVSEGCAPGWFLSLEVIHPEATIKFKHRVPRYSEYQRVFLVDDQIEVIAKDEKDWWVPVGEYVSPYPPDDCELASVALQIEKRLSDKD
jgi:acetylornithine deacetylase/succinyl-diaminopimelate desuccinylase-like protein